MFDRNSIEKIEEMSAEVKELEYYGIPHTSKSVHKVSRPIAAHITTHSLSAVSVFFNEKKDEMVDPFVHVLDQETVRIFSKLDDTHRNRENYLVSSLINDPFMFDRFMDIEMFVIALQSQFVQDGTTAAILKVVGNLTEEAEQKVLDDGVSQTVTAKTGIAKVENVHVPNPVVLKPFRTFQEVEQPASKFVFRMKKSQHGEGPTCALFEADGGAWKNDAIANIKGYLESALPDGSVIIA